MKISDLFSWFSQQQLSRKLVIVGVGLFFLVGTCVLSSAIFNLSNQASGLAASPTIQGADSLIMRTWTPTFNPMTFTPTPTLPTATPSPTFTRVPTETEFVTATLVILPTATIPVVVSGGAIVIVTVDKTDEYVDIQNIGAPVNLNGWLLVSERGNQVCRLNGIIQPKQVLRIWAGTHETGYSCGFLRTIWTDSQLDPAVLYNPQGKEVSRFP
jgi:hypothetical protein